MGRTRRLRKSGFIATVALTAIKDELTMAEMVKKFDVLVSQIIHWKKQLLTSAEVGFKKEDQLADEREHEVLELRVLQLQSSRRRVSATVQIYKR